MKRILHTILASFLFLTVCSLVGYFSRYIPECEFWVAFGIGAGILVVGIVLAFVKGTPTKIASFFVNAVSMGFFLRAWYINRGFDNPLWLMLGVTLLAVAYMAVYALPLYIPVVNRHYGWYLGIFVFLSLAGYVLLLEFTKTTWVSTLGYYGILQLSFILGSSFSCNDFDDEIRAYTFSSLSIIFCALIILAIVLGGDSCDCDCGGDCVDGGNLSSPVKRKDDNQPKEPLPPL